MGDGLRNATRRATTVRDVYLTLTQSRRKRKAAASNFSQFQPIKIRYTTREQISSYQVQIFVWGGGSDEIPKVRNLHFLPHWSFQMAVTIGRYNYSFVRGGGGAAAIISVIRCFFQIAYLK